MIAEHLEALGGRETLREEAVVLGEGDAHPILVLARGEAAGTELDEVAEPPGHVSTQGDRERRLLPGVRPGEREDLMDEAEVGVLQDLVAGGHVGVKVGLVEELGPLADVSSPVEQRRRRSEHPGTAA